MNKRNTGRQTRTVSCVTDDEFINRLWALARKEKVPQAVIVRRALDAELRRHREDIDRFFASGGK